MTNELAEVYARMDAAAFAEAQKGTYHSLDVGGLRVHGQYEMEQYLPFYGLPDDLTGKTALDVGTASGFFAFELERRGAKVTAVDLWDSVVFDAAARLRGSSARYVQKSIYDLDTSFGQFDFVFCGSLLLHLRDVFGAVQALRSVCAGEAIVSTAFDDDPRLKDTPVAEFIGDHAGDGDYWHYWRLNAAGLSKMLLSAGFTRTEHVSTFVLKSRPEYGYATLHGVVRATI